MPAGLRSLALLVGDPGPCPVCDEPDGTCSHRFYGDEHYRIGDPKEKHPILGRRYIPSPRRIEHDGRLMFTEGQLMTAEEAERFGVPIPQGATPRKKGHRRQRPSEVQGPQGPTEDRAHHPEANRKA